MAMEAIDIMENITKVTTHGDRSTLVITQD